MRTVRYPATRENVTHFEQQPTAIHNGNPKKQAVNRASRNSSYLSSIIEGNNIPNSITDDDVMISTHMGMYSQKSSAETEKIIDLVKISMKDEESLNVRYEELENKEKELMRRLEAVQTEKAEIAEQRTEKSKQTKDLMEKEAHRNKKERLMRIATTKLNDLSDQNGLSYNLSLSRFSTETQYVCNKVHSNASQL